MLFSEAHFIWSVPLLYFGQVIKDVLGEAETSAPPMVPTWDYSHPVWREALERTVLFATQTVSLSLQWFERFAYSRGIDQRHRNRTFRQTEHFSFVFVAEQQKQRFSQGGEERSAPLRKAKWGNHSAPEMVPTIGYSRIVRRK